MIVAKLLTIFSTASLSACASCITDFQRDHRLYVMNVKHQVCEQYKIVDLIKDKYQWEKSLPIAECDGYFALSPAGFNSARSCAQEAANNCKGTP